MSSRPGEELVDQSVNEATVEFGWSNANETCAHGYVLPIVLEELRRVTGGMPRRILDVGCGNGVVTAEVWRYGHDVIGIDASRDGIALARAAHPHVQFEAVSLYDAGLKDIVGTVDCVLALEVVEHLFLPRRLFEASYQVLRVGGVLVLSTPYHGFLKNLGISLTNGWDRHFNVEHDGGHIKFFSVGTLGRMAAASGFRIARWHGAGRTRWLWKSVVMVVEKT